MNATAASVPCSPPPVSQAITKAIIALAVMALAAALAWYYTPRQRLTDTQGKLDLETAVPRAFGDWKIDQTSTGGVINPQQSALLNKLYSQILTRTYVNSKGDRLMLSIAYGEDQRDGLALHYPEVCYPAQGFQLISNTPVTLSLADTKIPARRLETKLGNQRYEPVTYWFLVGTVVARSGIDQKLAQLRYGLSGYIPDGMLVRVSSIDPLSPRAFTQQQEFVQEMRNAIPFRQRAKVFGATSLTALSQPVSVAEPTPASTQ